MENIKTNRHNKSIKRTLPQIARLMMILFLLLILPMNIYLQLNIQHQNQKKNSVENFGQVEKLIENNEAKLSDAKEDFKIRCINSANTAAYYVEKFPSIVYDIKETKKLADKLGVDEIHYFNEEGKIYGGTHPEYYGYSFDSGKQMGFFKPMLYDKNLSLCQDIVPNTAEGKRMQYAAIWTSDGKNIVQIGMEPEHLLSIMDENNIQNTIKVLPMDNGVYLHIIDKNSGKIIASTNKVKDVIGKDAKDILKKSEEKNGEVKSFHVKYGNDKYCMYTKYYEEYLLVRSNLSRYPIKNILSSTFLVLLYLSSVFLIIINIIKWYVNKRLIKNLTLIIENLKKIEDGEIENIDVETGISEFDDLLSYINHMLDNIRSNWEKLSYIMDENNIPIGIFEKNKFYKKVYVNTYMLDILGIDNTDKLSSQEISNIVEKKIQEAESNVIDSKDNICEYCKGGEKIFIRIDKYIDKQSILYYITDISAWWYKINELKEKSEIDILTNLYNRRGFEEKVNILFENQDKMGYSMMIMADADNLKKINDLYGHDVGDEYLRQIGKILDDIELNHVSARLGGDEYAVFVYGASNLEELQEIVKKLKEKRGKKFKFGNTYLNENICFSMGVAYCPLDDTDINILTKIADKNMYEDKKKKKERYSR